MTRINPPCKALADDRIPHELQNVIPGARSESAKIRKYESSHSIYFEKTFSKEDIFIISIMLRCGIVHTELRNY